MRHLVLNTNSSVRLAEFIKIKLVKSSGANKKQISPLLKLSMMKQ
jgi:hypothetical protein